MSVGSQFFFDDFTRRDNVLRRMDARLKSGVVAALFAAILCSTRPLLPLLVSAVAIGTMLVLGLPFKRIAARFLAPFGIIVMIVGVQALMVGQTALYSFEIGGWELAVKSEGLARGGAMALRVWGAFSVLLLFSAVTSANELFRALRWCRMPHLWVEIAMLVYRYIFVLLEETSEMVAAQRVRLGYDGFRNSLRSGGGLMGAVVVRAVEQSLRTHEAMVARGYSDCFPFGPLPPLRRRAGGVLLVVVALIGGLFWMVEHAWV